MAKYTSSGGESYVKFQNVGDRHEGTLIGSQQKPNKFKPGTSDIVALFKRSDGTQFSVRITQTALLDAWYTANPKSGEYVIFTFEKLYPSKFGNPGKDISVDIPSRGEDGAGAPVAQQPTPVVPQGDLSQGRYDVLVAKLTEKVGPSFSAMHNMLTSMYPDRATREAELEKLAKQQGVV